MLISPPVEKNPKNPGELIDVSTETVSPAIMISPAVAVMSEPAFNDVATALLTEVPGPDSGPSPTLELKSPPPMKLIVSSPTTRLVAETVPSTLSTESTVETTDPKILFAVIVPVAPIERPAAFDDPI